MEEARLAYDPAVSPHFQVFLLPYFLGLRGYGSGHELVDLAIEQTEWPPATYDLYVFSSVTGQWEQRSFVREGEAAGVTVAYLRKSWHHHLNAVYRRGQLYVHCQTDFVMR
nr:unnamed protein product [Digitaria exilis]